MILDSKVPLFSVYSLAKLIFRIAINIFFKDIAIINECNIPEVSD